MFGEGARVQAGLEQTRHCLAVRTDRNGPELRRPVGRVQPPVFLQFPDQESENAGMPQIDPNATLHEANSPMPRASSRLTKGL